MVIRALKYAALLFAAYLIISAIAGVHGAAKFYNRSPVLYDKDGGIIAYKLSLDDKIRFLTEHKKVDPLYLKMLIASEDERFFYHLGVDPISIVRSLISNAQGYNLSGASTLAMQVARLLDKKERTLISKIKEAIQATYLTLYYGKERILDLYLTLAPFGSNIEGVSAASLMYFKHMPDKLTPDEAALLVALPRAPEKIRPDRHKKSALYYRNRVLDKACRDLLISPAVLDTASKADIDTALYRPSQSALHLGYRAFAASKVKEHYSYIDPKVQNTLNAVASSFGARASRYESLALIAIDNKSHTVAGYVGSSDSKRQFVDFAKARRSSGSLLKPFIYAMAFDRRIVLPFSIIDDKQKSFNTWQPKNYSREFEGQVSVADALVRSLNLPAVEILKALQPDEFLKIINKDDSVLLDSDENNLSLATGSAQSSLIALCELYAMLKNNGLYNAAALFYLNNKQNLTLPSLLKSGNTFKTRKAHDRVMLYESGIRFNERMISQTSAATIYKILKRVKRVKGYEAMDSLSYKTGTSYNYVDAHAIGSLGRYTIAVRTGRLDGSSNSPYTGFSRAAPVLFEIFSKLDVKDDRSYVSGDLMIKPPEGLSYLSFDNEKDLFDSTSEKLQINFPIDNSQIIPIDGRIYLDLRGGVPPYTVFVNGFVSDSCEYIDAKDFGLYNIVVRDAAGSSHAISVYVPAKNQ